MELSEINEKLNTSNSKNSLIINDEQKNINIELKNLQEDLDNQKQVIKEL